MNIGTYVDGRPLNFEDPKYDIGGTPVTLGQVLAYDSAGQIAWMTPELKAWAARLGAPQQPPKAEPKLNKMSGVLIGVGMLLFGAGEMLSAHDVFSFLIGAALAVFGGIALIGSLASGA